MQISLVHNSHSVILLIRDDGIGFNAGQNFNGNGLANIRKRAKEMNAQIDIESGEGVGTSVQLTLKA